MAPTLLSELLRQEQSRRTAIVSEGTAVTYSELRKRSESLSAALARNGVGTGERVLVLLPNGLAFDEAIFGAWQAGCVVVPVDHRAPVGRILHLAKDASASAMICAEPILGRVESRLGETPSVRLVINASSNRVGHEIYRVATGVDPADVEYSPASATDVALLAYTSGTTGQPKGVMHSHDSLMSSLDFTVRHLGLDADDRVLIALPLWHLFALRVLLAHLMVGATAVIEHDILAGIGRALTTRPNAMILVPAAGTMLAGEFAMPLARLSPLLRRLSIGAAPITTSLLDKLGKLLPETQLDLPYGMTECRIAYLEPIGERHDRRFLATDPELEISVVAPNGELVEEGMGEIVIRGRGLMVGYWHNTAIENHELRRVGFRTGDLAEVTAGGDRFLLGRLDTVIDVGGEKVFPAEVEAVLLTHPQIADAEVTAIPDPRGIRGEVVKARVVIVGHLERRDIDLHCRRYLEPFKIPAMIEVATSDSSAR